MDDDVIDLSHLPREAFLNRLRQLSDLSSCPCNTCRAICDRYDTIDKCDAYQLWYAERVAIRERFMTKISREDTIAKLREIQDKRTHCQCSRDKVIEKIAFDYAIKVVEMMPEDE